MEAAHAATVARLTPVPPQLTSGSDSLFGVPERERGKLDAIVESTKDDIVTSAAPAASQ
jgi:hypothetical protein